MTQVRRAIRRQSRGVVSTDYILDFPLNGSLSPYSGKGDLTFTRTGPATGRRTNGDYYIAGADEPRFVDGAYFAGPQVTNKCACYSVPNEAVGTQSFHNGTSFEQNIQGMTLAGDTAATLEIVTDQAEIVAAGLGEISPEYKCYLGKCAGGAGNGTVTITGSLAADGYIHYFTHDAGDGYNRVTTAQLSGSQLVIPVAPDTEVYFLIPELIEGSVVIANLPPVLTYGTAVTQYQDTGYCQTAGNIDLDEGTVQLDFTSTLSTADIKASTTFSSVITLKGNPSFSTLYIHGSAGGLASYDGTSVAVSYAALGADVSDKVILRYSKSGNVLQLIVGGVASGIKPFIGFPSTTGKIELLKGGKTGLSISNLTVESAAISEAEAIARTS